MNKEVIPSTCYRCPFVKKDGTCSKVETTKNYINGKQDNCPLMSSVDMGIMIQEKHKFIKEYHDKINEMLSEAFEAGYELGKFVGKNA